MNRIEADQVLQTIDARLAQFKRAFDRVFEVLAVDLTRVSRDLAVVRRSMGELADARSQAGLAGLLETVDGLARDVGRAMAGLGLAQAETARVLDLLRPQIDHLAASLIRIQEHADEIRKVALNASILVSKVGAAGAGFEVITRELITLSQQQATDAEWALASARDVQGEFDAVDTAGADLAQTASAVSTDAFERARDSLSAAIRGVELSIGQAELRVDAIQGSVGRTMVAIQTQDIMRQGLDHVRLVIAELIADQSLIAGDLRASDAADSVEACFFQERTCELSVRLLDEIGGDIGGLLDVVEQDLGMLLGVADELAQLRAQAGAGAAFECLVELERRASELADRYGQGVDLHERSRGSLRELARVVLPLVARLERVEEQQDTLRTLSLMVKLQTARSRSLATVATVADTLDRLHRQAVGDGGDGVDTSMSGAARTVRSLLREELETERVALGYVELVKIQAASASFQEASRTTMRRLGEQVDATVRSGVELSTFVRDVRQQLGALRESLAARAEIQEALNHLAREAQGRRLRLEAAGAVHREEVTTAKLAELIRRFTILSHKKLASGMDEASVEDGDAGGELTLF